jgi:hypothetical protein
VFNGHTHALEGTGTVVFDSANLGYVNTTSNTDLTIGSDITVRGKAGRVGNANATSSITVDGTIHSDEAGQIEVRSGGGWTNEGTLMASGTGTLRTRDTWSNNGTVEIGETSNMSALSGLPLTGLSIVTIDIGSVSDFGVIDVTGAAALAGVLNINLTGGFSPTTGQMFEIMTYDSMSGAFGTISAAGFTVDVGATAITLTAN